VRSPHAPLDAVGRQCYRWRYRGRHHRLDIRQSATADLARLIAPAVAGMAGRPVAATVGISRRRPAVALLMLFLAVAAVSGNALGAAPESSGAAAPTGTASAAAVGATGLLTQRSQSGQPEARAAERAPSPAAAEPPAQTPLGQATPAQASPAERSQAQASPAERSPAQASPAQASPAQASPAQASPAQASPAQASPAQASSAQASPAQASSAQASPAQASQAKESRTVAPDRSPAAAAQDAPGVARIGTPPVGGLTQQQMDHAATIVAAGQRAGLPERAYVVAIATALQESYLRNLANPAWPASLNLPHDGTGVDYDSVGLFQQRPSTGWGPVDRLMDPASAATRFYQALAQVPSWERLPVTVAAQAVQGSAFPYHYAKHEPLAREIVDALTP
jgi:hypothetical protein